MNSARGTRVKRARSLEGAAQLRNVFAIMMRVCKKRRARGIEEQVQVQLQL